MLLPYLPRGFLLLRAWLPGFFFNSFILSRLPLNTCPIPLVREALTGKTHPLLHNRTGQTCPGAGAAGCVSHTGVSGDQLYYVHFGPS